MNAAGGKRRDEEFEPSHNLRRLVQHLLDPEVESNIAEACRRAGCSRQVWYRAAKAPGFARWWRARVADAFVDSLAVTFRAHMAKVRAGSDTAIKLAYVVAGVLDGKGELVCRRDDGAEADAGVDLQVLGSLARRLADLGVPESELGILALLPAAAADSLPPQQSDGEGGRRGQS